MEQAIQKSLFDGHDTRPLHIAGKTIKQAAGAGGKALGRATGVVDVRTPIARRLATAAENLPQGNKTAQRSAGSGGPKFKCPEPVKVARHWDGMNFINAKTGEFLCFQCKTEANVGIIVRGRVYCSKCGRNKK